MANDNYARDLPQEEYQPVVSQTVNMSMLEAEITVSAFDFPENHVFTTCYGDIRKTVDALRDYARLLEMVCVAWDLQCWQRVSYEIHADKLRQIAGKLQTGIGYDYDATVEKCKKRMAKKGRRDDPGGEAMEMAYIRSQKIAAVKEKEAAEQEFGADGNDPWTEDL